MVVPAGVGREEVCGDGHDERHEPGERHARDNDDVGFFLAVEGDDEVADDVGERKDDKAAVGWPTKETPDFSGGEIRNNQDGAGDGGKNPKQ